MRTTIRLPPRDEAEFVPSSDPESEELAPVGFAPTTTVAVMTPLVGERVAREYVPFRGIGMRPVPEATGGFMVEGAVMIGIVVALKLAIIEDIALEMEADMDDDAEEAADIEEDDKGVLVAETEAEADADAETLTEIVIVLTSDWLTDEVVDWAEATATSARLASVFRSCMLTRAFG